MKFTAVVINKYQLRIAEDRSGDKGKYRQKFERRVSSILKGKLPWGSVLCSGLVVEVDKIKLDVLKDP